jgi:putative ABC transport system substrate-binding protein
MRRREFLVAAGALVAPRLARALATGPVRRVAIFELGGHRMLDDQWRILEARLREHGYEEGRNLAIDRRNAGGAEARLAPLAQELLARKPEVVIVTTTPAAQTLQRLTQTIPIVITGTADPVATGLVASLARPGGNITGVSLQLNDIAVMRVEMLREMEPQIRRIAMLGPAANAGVQAVFRLVQKSIQTQGVELRIYDASDTRGIARVRGAGRGSRRCAADDADPLLVPPAGRRTRRAPPHPRRLRRPGDPGRRRPARARAQPRLYRHVADYVRRILEGARPADLAILQPTEFWLGVNLRTARELGLRVPQSLLVRADRVIE